MVDGKFLFMPTARTLGLVDEAYLRRKHRTGLVGQGIVQAHHADGVIGYGTVRRRNGMGADPLVLDTRASTQGEALVQKLAAQLREARQLALLDGGGNPPEEIIGHLLPEGFEIAVVRLDREWQRIRKHAISLV